MSRSGCRRVLRRALTWALLLVISAAGQAEVHESPHQRPTLKGPIDPKQSFQFLVLSGAGGHFHTLLPFPDLKTLFAGTHLGLFRSDDRGLTWRLAASRFSGDDVHALARDPKSGTLYAATHRQGLLLSRDGGRQWRRHTPGLPGRDLHALALDPRHPQILYVWVVGHGLFRTDDRGNGWKQLTGSDTLTGVESLAVHPEESERLYAGTAKGVWMSEDGGRHWRFPDGDLSYPTAGVAVPQWRPTLLFAATLEGAFVGNVDGTAWTRLPPHPSWWGPVIGFAFLPDRPETVFVVAHEGVVAARRLAAGDWTPLASLER